MQARDWAGATGDVWAEEWPRTDRTFEPVDRALVEAAAACVGDRTSPGILDVGCGAGTTSLSLMACLPEARLTGVDLSLSLVEAARRRAGPDNRCRFEVADAGQWTTAEHFDLLVSRHGVMFFDDPVGAFRHLRTLAAPGGRFAFSCFRSPSLNPWASAIARLLPDPPPAAPFAPGPFAFADDRLVAGMLADAGWQEAEAAPIDYDYVAGAGADPIADALGFFSRIGPSAFAMRQLEGEAKLRFREGLEAIIAEYCCGDRVVFPAAAWIWTMRA